MEMLKLEMKGRKKLCRVSSFCVKNLCKCLNLYVLCMPNMVASDFKFQSELVFRVNVNNLRLFLFVYKFHYQCMA